MNDTIIDWTSVTCVMDHHTDNHSFGEKDEWIGRRGGNSETTTGESVIIVIN